MMHESKKPVARPFAACAALIATSLLANCATTTAIGNSGCQAYGEARLSMPVETDTLSDAWLKWLAEADTRMTAVCR